MDTKTIPGKVRPWIFSRISYEQATAKYKGKDFIIEYERDRAVQVHVNSVDIKGGVVFAFCSVTKVLRRYKNKHVEYPENVSVYAGRLEPVKGGDA